MNHDTPVLRNKKLICRTDPLTEAEGVCVRSPDPPTSGLKMCELLLRFLFHLVLCSERVERKGNRQWFWALFCGVERTQKLVCNGVASEW